jgi:hypothetical protein
LISTVSSLSDITLKAAAPKRLSAKEKGRGAAAFL